MLSKNIEIQKFNAYSTMYQCKQSMYIFGIQRAGERAVERLEILESKIGKFGHFVKTRFLREINFDHFEFKNIKLQIIQLC